MLERDVQIRQNPSCVHDRNEVIDMRIGIEVMQAHPCTMFSGQFAQRFRHLGDVCLDRTAAPESCPEFGIKAISARILRDDQQFLHT